MLTSPTLRKETSANDVKNLKLDTIYFSEKNLNEWFEYEHDLIKPKSCSNCINSNLKKGFDFLEIIIEKEIKFFKWKCNNCGNLILKNKY